MHRDTFSFIAARAAGYPTVWRKGQFHKAIPGTTTGPGIPPDPTGRWLLLNTLETNRLLRGHAVQKA